MTGGVQPARAASLGLVMALFVGTLPWLTGSLVQMLRQDLVRWRAFMTLSELDRYAINLKATSLIRGRAGGEQMLAPVVTLELQNFPMIVSAADAQQS